MARLHIIPCKDKGGSMIRHHGATIRGGEFVDVYECEECANRQFIFKEEDKEECNLCGHNNHKKYLQFLKEQASVGYL